MQGVRTYLWCLIGLLAACSSRESRTSASDAPSPLRPSRCGSYVVPAGDSDFGQKLISKVSAATFYLEEALRYGEAGEVDLCIDVNASGDILTTVLQKSSGFPALDGSAIYAVGKAFPNRRAPSPLPFGLSPNGADVWFSVPVQFTDRDSEAPVPIPPCTPADQSDNAEEDFGQRLLQGIQTKMFYPPEAVQASAEGYAKVEFHVRPPDSTFYKASLTASSGNPLLDGAALITVGAFGVSADRPCLPVSNGASKEQVIRAPISWALTAPAPPTPPTPPAAPVSPSPASTPAPPS